MRIDLTTTSGEQSGPTPDVAGPVDDELREIRRNQIIAFAILVLLVLGGVGWGVWKWRASRPPNERLVDVPMGGTFRPSPGNVAVTAGRRPQPPPPPADGVRKIGTVYRVRAGQSTFVAAPDRKPGEWRINFSYDPPRSTPDQQRVILARVNSAAAGITPEQQKQLDALGPFNAGMTVSPDDQAKIDGLWKAYVAAADDAARANAEKPLVTALAEVGSRSEQPTRDAIQARVDKIKAILKPEQIDRLPR